MEAGAETVNSLIFSQEQYERMCAMCVPVEFVDTAADSKQPADTDKGAFFAGKLKIAGVI